MFNQYLGSCELRSFNLHSRGCWGLSKPRQDRSCDPTCLRLTGGTTSHAACAHKCAPFCEPPQPAWGFRSPQRQAGTWYELVKPYSSQTNQTAVLGRQRPVFVQTSTTTSAKLVSNTAYVEFFDRTFGSPEISGFDPKTVIYGPKMPSFQHLEMPKMCRIYGG